MALIEIHKLTPKGLEVFHEFIEHTRSDEALGLPQVSLPSNLLTDGSLSQLFSPDKVDPQRVFSNRYEMSKYIYETWTSFQQSYFEDVGVWAWFSVLYFDQLRQTRKKTLKGKPYPSTQRAEHFIPDEYVPSAIRPVPYRNAIRYPFQMWYNKFPDEFLRICLVRGSVSDMGDAIEQIGFNKKILRSPAMMNLIIQLYYDPSLGRAKPGITDKPAVTKKGLKGQAATRRLTKTIVPRVKKTFDIHDMSASELIDACGQEVKNSKWVK
ncbi:hypothetical protein N9381_08630 [Paracoccaceae bacterium]|nr:hypothetical protein [Paracoccaceae bacterium]